MEKFYRLCKDTASAAEDYRELSDRDRKLLVQRFINQIIYDREKFKTAVRLIEKWESSNS